MSKSALPFSLLTSHSRIWYYKLLLGAIFIIALIYHYSAIFTVTPISGFPTSQFPLEICNKLKEVLHSDLAFYLFPICVLFLEFLT